MIDVIGVTHHYRIRPVLRDVHMHIRTGELVALMGPNGSGKSTLMSVAAGALAPLVGSVEIDGVRRRASVDQEIAIRKRAVYLPAEPWLPLYETGHDWLLAVGRLYDVPYERLVDHAERLLDLFNLLDVADSPIRALSTGQRKKVALAGVLITDAPILMLDEPFAGGLDPSGLLALKTVLKRGVQEGRLTVLMATPVPELVDELADRVAVLKGGQLVAFDTIPMLRASTKKGGGLDQIYEQLVSGSAGDQIARYFGRES